MSYKNFFGLTEKNTYSDFHTQEMVSRFLRASSKILIITSLGISLRVIFEFSEFSDFSCFLNFLNLLNNFNLFRMMRGRRNVLQTIFWKKFFFFLWFSWYIYYLFWLWRQSSVNIGLLDFSISPFFLALSYYLINTVLLLNHHFFFTNKHAPFNVLL